MSATVKREGLFVAPVLMLAFGAIAVWFGVTKVLEARANPVAVAVACDRAAIEEVGPSRWVVVDDCEPDWDAAVERKIGGAEKLVVSLRRAPPSESEENVALGTIRSSSMKPVAVEGITAAPIDGLPVIELGDEPSKTAGFVFLAGGVGLLGLAAFFFRRALRDAAELDARVQAPSPWSAADVPRGVAPSRKRGTFLDRGDDFNFMLLLAGPPLIGIAILVQQYVGDDPTTLSPWLIMAVFVVPFAIAFAWVWVQQRGEDAFPARLRGEAGTLPPDAEVVTYEAVVSLIAITMRFPSRPLVVGVDALGPTRAIATALTLLLGWWGIPWGPVYSIASITRNLRAGTRQRLADHRHDPRIDLQS